MLRKDFIKKINEYKIKVVKLTKKSKTIFVLSIPVNEKNQIINSLLLIQSGKIIQSFEKKELPNYGVFDEKRYFSSKTKKKLLNYNNKNIDFLICEDMWSDNFESYKSNHKIDYIFIINASFCFS